MPKIEKIGNGHWRYRCECGCLIDLNIDLSEAKYPPKSVKKCFMCQQRFTKENIDYLFSEAI